MKKLILLLALFSSSAFAQILPFPARMEKLSHHLRGKPLSLAEKKELRAVSPGDEEAYFREQAKAYLAGNEGTEAFTHWQLERLKMNTVQKDYYDVAIEESLSSLIRKTFRENRSWDALLTSREYDITVPVANQASPYQTNANKSQDSDFFALAMPGLPRANVLLGSRLKDGKQEEKSTTVRFEERDNRLAGVLTTARFARRFTTTDVNKNRRRASQVYRVFLCDPMFPAIPDEPDRKNKFLEHIFKQHADAGSPEAELKISTETAHGSSASCMGCHSKLDPMGRTFQKMNLVLHKDASPGMLVLRRKGGDLLQRVSGIGELADTIVKQPEYVSCQIRWFWKQYIGKNVPLSEKTQAELVKAFEKVGRRTKDFIFEVVQRPEFASAPSREASLRFTAVKDLLKRCDSCHEGALLPFNPTALPFDQLYWNKPELIVDWLLKAKGRVNLPAGDAGKMPQNWHSWADSDLAQVKRWLDNGAQDDEGKKWLEAE